MLLTVAFDYGARQELIDAVRQTRAEGEEVTTDAIAAHLYLPELPPVDVLVRTSGEQRVSNFLLWQSAGAAIHFTDKPWPEFDAAELDAALALVRRRVRDPPGSRSPPRSPTSPPGCPAPSSGRASSRDGRARRGGDRRAAATSSCRPAPARARRSPTSCRPSLSGARVVVATATKALQDQLAGKDLPFLAGALPTPFDFAVLKGRSNYVCLQRLREVQGGGADAQLELDGHGGRARGRRSAASPSGPAHSDSGDAAELDWSPSDAAWRSVSVGSDECPGADRCPLGEPVLRRAGPPTRRRGRRDRRQHAPLRAARRQWRRDPARARRRGVRRGPRARGRDERHRRRPAGAGTLHHDGRDVAPDPRGARAASPASSTSPTCCATRSGPHAGQRLPQPYPGPIHDALVEARMRLDRVAVALATIQHARRRRQAAQAAGPDPQRAGHRAPRPGPRPPGRVRRLRVGLGRPPPAGDRPPRRRADAARGRVGRSARRS